MVATLLQRLTPLSWLTFLVLVLGLARPAQATHLLGGEMTYRYLDAAGPTLAPRRYELTVSLYVACSSAATASYLDLDFYNKATGARLVLTSTNLGSSNASVYSGSLELTQPTISTCTTIAVPPGCTITGASQPYQLQKFVGIVCLPTSAAGFYVLTAPSGNRNANINNLAGGGNNSAGYALALYSTLVPASTPNNSPVFTGNAVGLICAGDTTVVLNNAVDADGDRLEYTFGQPYDYPVSNATFTPPPAYVPYTTTGGYSAATPLGTGAGYYAKINLNTGLTKYVGGPTVGNRYSVAIDVTEYRTINGVEVALGTTRRDIQLIVGSCPPSVAPTFPPPAALARSYTVEAGGTLSIPITASQSAGHPLTLTATSTLLDGSGGYNATFAGNTGTPTYAGSPVGAYTVAGTTGGTVAGTFVYTPACTEARATPYDVTLALQDIGCAGKLTSDVLRITVVKPTGPTAVAGPLSVCGLNTNQTYTASGGTAPIVQWTVTGGTIVGSATANPVTVRWTTAGTGTLTAQGVTQYGCLVDLVTKSVLVAPTPVLTVTGNLAICQGGSTTLTVTGGSSPYILAGGATPVSGPGPFVVSPTQTTTYTVTPLLLPANGCPAMGQVTVTVNPRPAANAGAAVTICPGGTAQLGAAPVAGSTYSWSPATGLSSPTVANPTVTLPNTTGAPITQTYTLTETSALGNCQASNPVTVTVTPPPVATPGVAVTICSGGTGQLGAAPVAGLSYSWSPAAGLSNASIANPTVTLTNTTGAPISQTYTLTVSTGTNCSGTGTVVVTVNPLPVADAGAAVSFCSGSTGQLGAAAVTGLTYSWSPATGLSSPTVANPTVTLTNTTGAPITQTYTLTVTNAATSCARTSTVVVTVNPLPVANAGAAVAICSGSTGQLGAAPVAGYTYSWSPATGLSNASLANPTVTLTNTTGAPITQTYTLTVTRAGCAGTSTVVVTVNPLPTATAGAAVSFCSGGTGQLGAAPVAGLSYSWSPAAGLSNASIANPTVTLTNTTGAPITQTYTLTVTGAGSCASTSTVAVTVNPQPAANAGAAVSFCSGGTGQLGAAPMAGLSYSWSPATGLSNANSANPTVTLTNTTGAPTTQTYTLTVTRAGCVGTSTVAVTVNPQPIASAGTAISFCSGGTGQLGATAVTGLTYSWSPATGLSSPTVANPTVTLTNTTGAPITQTYTLTVTGAGTCAGTSTVAVTVNPLPVANAGAAVSFCSGGTGQLGAAPVAGLSYSWSPAAGLSNASIANPTVTLTNTTGAPITQTYTLTVTRAGCAGTSTVAVTVNPLPVANAGAAVAICSGGTGQLGAVAVAGATYSWSPATGLSNANLANPTVTLTNTTGAPITQPYALTVTGTGNCVSTSTVMVTVNPLPVADAGAAVAICSGSAGQLGAAAVAGLTYSWSPATGLSNASLANPTVTLTNTTGAPTTQTYTLTVTNAATSCVSTGTVAVTVNPLPVADAGAAVAICSGSTGQLGTAAVAGVGYSWSPATGLSSSTVANPAVNLSNTTSAPITRTYTLTATSNSTNCLNTSTVVVTVNPLPVAAPGAASTICSGGTAQLGAAPVAGFGYSWSPATGLSSATVANPTATLTNPTATAATQVYTLTTTNLATTCASTATVAITVSPVIVPGAIGTDQTVCAGAVPAPLTSTAAASGGRGAYDYQWESSPDMLTWKAIANVTSLSYAPSAIAVTTYYRRRVTVGTCGMAYTNVVTVQAQQLLLPTVALPTLPAQCAGLALTFTPAPANAGAAPTYRWFVNGTQVATGPTYTSSTLADGDVVQVELTPTVGFCATGTAIAATRVSLTAVPVPALTMILRTALPVCVGAPISFSLDRATNVGTNPQYQWQVDGTNVSGATATNFTSTTLRDGQVVTLTLRTTDACGQPATATSNAAPVRVNPPVHVSAGPDKTITEGESVTLEGTADGSYPVTWTPSSTLTLAVGGDPLRPLATPLATTTYTLAAGAGYCADQSSMTVTVLRRVRIPNAFTPNADNNDDTWQIAGIEDYPGSHVLVFNRWGQKVFEAAGYNRSNEWNGTLNGGELPFATYYYVITLGNGKSYTGPLTVVR